MKTISISTNNLTIRKLEDKHLYLEILEAYITENVCSNEKKFANLYVCYEIVSKDTLIVIEECKPPLFFLTKNYSGEKLVTYLDKDSVLYDIPKQIWVDIPKDVSLPKNSKYIFSSLIGLSD